MSSSPANAAQPAESYPRELEDDGEEHIALIQSDYSNAEDFRTQPTTTGGFGEERTTARRRWTRRWQKTRCFSWKEDSWAEKATRILVELYKSNVGLLLIALSQLCGSCMNVSVKILNGLDPPVPPFEVSVLCFVC